MSRIAVKSPGSGPLGSKQQQQQAWNSGVSSVAGPRLSKAKSSPNVFKTTTITPVIGIASKQNVQRQQNVGVKISGNSNNKSQTIQSKSARNVNNVTIVQITGSPDQQLTPKSCRISSGNNNGARSVKQQQPKINGNNNSSSVQRTEARKKLAGKDTGGSSCTILEDRALLKKGLGAMTRKPDEPMRKKNLNRSTSLWSVQSPEVVNTSKQAKTTPRSADSRFNQKQQQSKNRNNNANVNTSRGSLNRATSLWSVPVDPPQCRLGRLPSRIPLSTQHLAGLGQSLGDLCTVVDPSVETTRQSDKPNDNDVDEVDRSVDEEHIYENCREAVVVVVTGNDNNDKQKQQPHQLESPIYENLQSNKISKDNDDDTTKMVVAAKRTIDSSASSRTVPLTTLELEKRAEELLSQLDEDDPSPAMESTKAAQNKIIDLAACRLNIERSRDILSKSRENLMRSREELARSKENLTKSHETLEKSRVLTKSQGNLFTLQPYSSGGTGNKRAIACEMSIKEIRRNWERQIEKSASDEAKLKATNKRLSKSSVNICSGADLAIGEKTNQPPKKAKEIEQLVNFFNCKNKESMVAAGQVQHQESANVAWTAKGTGSKDAKKKTTTTTTTTIVTTSAATKAGQKKSSNGSCGYVSDGNSSEDSGHISNENESDEIQEIKGYEDEEEEEDDESVIEGVVVARGNSETFLRDVVNQERLFADVKDNEGRASITKDGNSNGIVIVKAIAAKVVSVTSSSGASSIESWDEGVKTINALGLRKGGCNGGARPTPTQRQNVGSSQIFFRAGALERLESQRDEKLTGHIILLQARCRGYLARQKLNKLKLQDLAVRCIQKNVRKLMSVREWPWWRLYVKVAPLLNVHRTEDQLKARTEELEILRAKVDRLEQERNHLKYDNDRLEAKLSEMTADFAEEHSTSTLAAVRIDAEQSERMRLERELQDVSETNKNLQQHTERLEMELLYARAADLNGLASDGEDGDEAVGVYKQRYQYAMRELEFTKRKMAQQHEDDLEQLVGLKKQLEKKLADAYEEVEEQRQVVGQWKRRVQKLNGEMHDLRLLLEEQTARNNLLEKKQRKFDSETQNFMDDLRQEKIARERLAREKEIAIAEKFTIEQNLSDARLEIELKEERLQTLSQELEELTFGGKTEEEVAQLKKAKHELEKKVKDQEEELDDLAGQVQLLEQAKLRIEMSIEQQRKEMRKEMQLRDEELEDVRGSAMKKVKALEQQLENEHEERTIVLREKHELEHRLVALEEQERADRAAEAETTQRLKRDLKRTRALLRDAQTMLERSKGDSTGKAAMRHLKNQLEDAECARTAAVKAKQALEQELSETQAALEEATRQRSEAEDRANSANRERADLLSQLEENEEELAEMLKKYRAAVQQVSDKQAQLQEFQAQVAALESEKLSLKDQLSELSQRLESVEQLGDPTANSLATSLGFRAKELESKLELEQTTRARLETQITRLKETVDKLQSESALLRTKEQSAQDAARRLQRSLRETREEAASATSREQEATRSRRDLEKALEVAEAETKAVKDDLRLALQRIDDLQSAIQGELDLDCSEEGTSDNSDSD